MKTNYVIRMSNTMAMRVCLSACILVFAGLLPSSIALGWQCAAQSAQEQFAKADIVFLGSAQDRDSKSIGKTVWRHLFPDQLGDDVLGYKLTKTRFLLKRVLKGSELLGRSAQIAVIHSRPESPLGVSFEISGFHLVFVSIDNKGRYLTNGCMLPQHPIGDYQYL